MSYWLFQGNPNYYRLLEGIREHERLSWSVHRYGEQMIMGEGVLLWLSAPSPGIYAIAEIVKTPEVISDARSLEDKIRIGAIKQSRVLLRITRKLLDKPLVQEELQKDLFLQNLTIIHQPQVRECRVRPEEWQRVHELIRSR